MLFGRCAEEVAIQVLGLLKALLTSFALNQIFITQTNAGMNLIGLIFTFILVIVFEFLLSWHHQINGIKCGIKIKNNIRNALVQILFQKGPAYVQEKRTGELNAALVGKVEALEPYYTTYLPSGIATVLTAVSVSLYLCSLDLLVGSICFLGFCTVIVVPNFWNKLMFKYGEEDWRLAVEFQADMMDNLQGMYTLKAFNSSEERGKRLEKLAWKMHDATMKDLSVSQIESALLIFGATVGSTVSVAAAIYRTINGSVELNELVIIFFLVTACFSPVFSLIDAWHLGYHGLTAAPAILDLLNEECRNIEHKIQKKEYKFPLSLSFENVSFRYNAGEKVLNNLSLVIPPCKTTALIGRSGSGKSTIINLLAGFYSVQEGEIRVNGEAFDVDSLRDRIGIVWQDSYLFYGTIADNICFGKKNAAKEEIIIAAKKANIHDFIMTLPDKYETIVGERGLRLSGGEKQRIAIARCFLRDVDFLIFDEATANLDGENEALIQESINELVKNKTVLIVAHRLSTIMNADLIYVLDEGRIIQKGNHDSLMKEEGLYNELMRKQWTAMLDGEEEK